MQKRVLGRTNLEVSIIGMGGIPIRRPSEDDAVAVLRHAMDSGINYFDTARGYVRSEERLAKAIAGRREQCVIASKAGDRTKEALLSSIEESLKTLGTDYIDVYKYHGVSQTAQLDRLLAPDGPLEGLKAAQQQGKIRYIGLSGHNPDVLVDAVRTGQFDVILVACNFVKNEAAHELLPLCRELDVGVTIMKPLGGSLLASHADLALRWVLQHPVSTVPVGMWRKSEVDYNVRVGETFERLTAEEQSVLDELAAMWDRSYCRLCYRHRPCPKDVPIDNLMITDLMYRRHGMPELMGERSFKQDVAAAGACATCEEKQACTDSCTYKLSIPELLSRVHETYMPIIEQYERRHGA